MNVFKRPPAPVLAGGLASPRIPLSACAGTSTGVRFNAANMEPSRAVNLEGGGGDVSGAGRWILILFYFIFSPPPSSLSAATCHTLRLDVEES